ncbi:MAG: flavodoxin-dependent (E)-4-hydroxy-3-methylbut-2-enyl-diphosphate synthase [Phycisphaerae bacterium]|jgi:(E)-4-hydroxy-3-methylbut-2-enyl-diphosphate synthase
MNRRKTVIVKAGPVKIGSGYPVAIQSMTNVPTVDVARCVRQVRQLIDAGCALVRIAVPTKLDTAAFAKIAEKTGVPLIADVHFSAERAIEAIEAGAAKIRLNPGNIKNPKDVTRIIAAAKMHHTAVRAGVNEASIRDLKLPDVPMSKRVSLMLREMKKYVRIFEKQNFGQLVLSAKSADPLRTIEINRLIAENFDYPIHLGLTHAGLPEDAEIPSAVSIGTLLAEGIGDTIRVSIAGNPLVEVDAAKKILMSLGLYERTEPELIVCPTCARAQVDIISFARKIKKALRGIHKPLRIAVMGCIVNGPGEAKDADLAVCAGKNKAFLYRKGKKIADVPEKEILPVLLKQIELIR